MAPRILGLLLFLVFVEDSGCAYAPYLGSPMGWVRSVLVDPTPIKLRGFDLFMILLLVMSPKKASVGAMVRPMRTALFTVLGTTVSCFVYGLARGGDARAASWQTYLIASMVLTAFTVASVCTTPAAFATLGKWLIAAGVYRAIFCWASYFTWAKDVIGGSGAFLTDHADTITWVTGIMVMLAQMIGKRPSIMWLRNCVGIFMFLGAVQWNSRRLAWVSLVMGFVVMYFLFPKGPAKRRFGTFAKVAGALLVCYVVVGWGRKERIFLPLASFSSISTTEDGSTLARNAENLGLIFTSNNAGLLLGTGWGRPYDYLTLKYDISGFALWRYVPHNSILGLLAYTGMLGFIGFWLALPTAVFFLARVARLAAEPLTRTIALIGAAELIVCANQLYGDMGIFSAKPMYVIATSYAMALRLPRVARVWGVKT